MLYNRPVSAGSDNFAAVAQRGQAVRCTAGSVLAIVVVAAVLMSGCAGDSGRDQPSGSPALKQDAGVYIVDPAAKSPPLPADRPIGPALFAYTFKADTFLVTADGQQYSLGATRLDAFRTLLSPDGRFLLASGQLRDLTGVANRRVDISGPVKGWSTSGRWLLEDFNGYRVLDTVTGSAVTVSAPVEPIAVLDDGSVLVEAESGHPKILRLRVLDPATGRSRRDLTIDATSFLAGEDGVVAWHGDSRGVKRAQLGPNGRLMLEVGGDANSHALALVVSLDNSEILGRVDAPVARQASPGWSCVGLTDSGALLRSGGPNFGTDIDLTTVGMSGEFLARYRVPADAKILGDGAFFAW